MSINYELQGWDNIKQETLLIANRDGEGRAIAYLADMLKASLQEIAVPLGLSPKGKNLELATNIFKKWLEQGFPIPEGIKFLLDKAIAVNAVDRWEWNGSDIVLIHTDGDHRSFDTVTYDIGFNYIKTYLEGLIKATDLYSCCFKKEESDR